jgi:uncharacterized membrane protein
MMINFIGRLHPLLVHLPIGILLMVVLFEWLAKKKKNKSLRQPLRILSWIGFVTAFASSITGYLLSQSGDYDADAVSWHQWSAIVLTTFSFVYAWMRTKKKFKELYKFFSFLILFFVIITGHLGGTLTHGEDYLSFNFKKEEIDFSKIDLQKAGFYSDLVKPIFEEKCYSCHGSSKQKGKLRLDEPEYILKGGEDGLAIVPNRTDEGEMMYRLLLPRDDEDHMPPKEKNQLSEIEIEILKTWINAGAAFNETVVQVGQLENLQKIIGATHQNKTSIVPEGEVPPANQEVLNQLNKLGVVILPVAANSNYLSVNLINATSLDSTFDLLVKVKEQLIWLKASNQNISTGQLNKLSQLTSLTRLSLDHSQISDNDLAMLKSLKKLQSLNLNGTSISSKGLKELNSLDELKTIYIYQTLINEEDLGSLKQAFPKSSIEFGRHQVPMLSSDTIEAKAPEN